jgi:hypothetical protein
VSVICWAFEGPFSIVDQDRYLAPSTERYVRFVVMVKVAQHQIRSDRHRIRDRSLETSVSVAEKDGHRRTASRLQHQIQLAISIEIA